MKKKGLLILCLLALMISAVPASAQTRYRRSNDGRRYEQRVSDWRYRNQVTSTRRYRGRDWDRSFWDRHRDKLTTAIGAGSGAAVGAAVGGKKGAIIGAIVGGAGAALYTYKIRDDDRDWRRQRRRY
jgi:hypothetical protein